MLGSMGRSPMKVSEKTLELNICAQMHSAVYPRVNLLWFGLTQRQEAQMGFDACTRLGGRLLIFQFKASNHRLRSGARKFQLSHAQLRALHSLARGSIRSVFYAFPLVGNTQELLRYRNLLDVTWLLDVSGLPALAAPTKRNGMLRRSGRHNAYVVPPVVSIRSDPVEVPLIHMRELVTNSFGGMDGLIHGEENFSRFWDLKRHFSRGARGLVVY